MLPAWRPTAQHSHSTPLPPCSCPRPRRRGTWATRGTAAVLASTLRTHRAAPRWWQAATAWPFRLFTGLLRRHLGQKMLIACEATVELYMGLAASPQMQARPLRRQPACRAQLCRAPAAPAACLSSSAVPRTNWGPFACPQLPAGAGSRLLPMLPCLPRLVLPLNGTAFLFSASPQQQLPCSGSTSARRRPWKFWRRRRSSWRGRTPSSRAARPSRPPSTARCRWGGWVGAGGMFGWVHGA